MESPKSSAEANLGCTEFQPGITKVDFGGKTETNLGCTEFQPGITEDVFGWKNRSETRLYRGSIRYYRVFFNIQMISDGKSANIKVLRFFETNNFYFGVVSI